MKLLFLTLILLVNCGISYGQIEIKADYIMTSPHRDIDAGKTEGTEKTGVKGDAKIISGVFNIPLSFKIDEKERPTMWSMTIMSSYTTFNNNKGKVKSSIDIAPSKIGNFSLSVSHLRPISEKWFVYASLGIGVYADHANIGKLRARNFMGEGNFFFIMQILPNLQVGAGLALDNNFGYPMAYPAFFVEWSLEGKYHVNIGMNGLNAGVEITDYFNLNLVGGTTGSLALLKKDGKEMMFTHQYITGGIQPEFKIGKSISIPITLGVSAYRPAYYQGRTIKDLFRIMGRDDDPYFSVSPYASIAFRWGF